MEMKRKSIFKELTSLVLAVVMVFSVITVMPQDVAAAELAFGAKGGTVTITDDMASDLTWIRIKPKDDGYLQVKFSKASAIVAYPLGLVQFCDAGKRELSPMSGFNTVATSGLFYTEYYGVKKGKTYYIKVASDGGVKVTAKLTKVKDKSGKKKSKALNIKKGKKGVIGVISAGTTKAKWYKIKVPKKQKLKIKFSVYLTDGVQFSMTGPHMYPFGKTYYGKNASVVGGQLNIQRGNFGDQRIISLNGKADPGTYYISVRPTAKTTNGYFKISW